MLYGYGFASMLPSNKAPSWAYSKGAIICKNLFLGGGLFEGGYSRVYGSGSQPFLYRGTLSSSLNIWGTPITKHKNFLFIVFYDRCAPNISEFYSCKCNIPCI